ncbi:hypothetical protein IJ118_00415 [Candidatus Saccharibacteria bacterium]|nr:hypothetical protein [Candidatus Saccharibacteria bacterium]
MKHFANFLNSLDLAALNNWGFVVLCVGWGLIVIIALCAVRRKLAADNLDTASYERRRDIRYVGAIAGICLVIGSLMVITSIIAPMYVKSTDIGTNVEMNDVATAGPNMNMCPDGFADMEAYEAHLREVAASGRQIFMFEETH